MIDQKKLKELLSYDPATGVFTWRVSMNGRTQAGDVAGSFDVNGYRRIGVNRRSHKAHRLAWLYMTGEWPKAEIDHRNGSRADNRWINLRESDPILNAQNQRKAQSDSTTGFLGVSPLKGRFLARIKAGGKRKNLGTFSTPEQAHAAYLKAKRELHAGCTI